MANHWEVLELTPGASEADIKAAFRKKAHLMHPDKGGSAAEFKQLYKAYEDCMHDVGVVDIDLGEIFAGYPNLNDLFDRIGMFGERSSIATGKSKLKSETNSNQETNETGGQQNMVNERNEDPIFGDPLHILDMTVPSDIASLDKKRDQEEQLEAKAESLDEAEENGGAGILDW